MFVRESLWQIKKMERMIINLIRNFLIKHQKGISLEELETFLSKKKISDSALEIIYKSKIFKLYNGMIFLKSALVKYKEDFLKEFDDYLQGKAIKKNLRNNIVNYLIISIPEILFMNWLDISLERKLLIFELLFNMLMKPTKIKDRLKIYFNNLIEFYSIVVIYSMLLLKNSQENFNLLIDNIKSIEVYENNLKIYFLNILNEPENVKSNLLNLEKEFNLLKYDIQEIFKNIFMPCYQFSPKLLNRILNKEFKDFEYINLLSRFEYESYYEWISVLSEESEQPNHNLFKDLGL